MRLLVLLLLTTLAAGCAAAAPALRPVELRQHLLRDERIAQWYASHLAPRYRPDLIFDRASAGYVVRLEARVGPAPRRLEALVDRQTGTVLSLTEK